MLMLKNGTVHVMTWAVPPSSQTTRQFAVCVTPVQGTERGWCGALVEVTDRQLIRVTDDCGHPENHRVAEVGPDALGLTGP